MFKTIAAISSGVVNQPISIIRVSGSEAFSIVSKIFTGDIGNDKTITYGYIKNGEEKIDEVLVNWFKGPNTFTGEDIVEINAHGGVINSRIILELLLGNGATIAEPGEFSRRGFLNGKMDLIKAEAIHDLIFAKTAKQAKMSVLKFDGNTTKLIDKLKSELLEIIATCETNIDYPEYDDVEILTTENIIPKLEVVKKKLLEIKKSSETSRYIFDGVNVAIIGKPNVGKSSLLNAILREDKAIVTNIPGTTRDIVEGQIVLGDVLLNFKDTAGIHNSNNLIESVGITKSIKSIEEADLIIWVVDSINSEDENIYELIKNREVIKVFNKSDIEKVKNEINISAKNNNIKELLNEIKSKYSNLIIDDRKVVNNSRQMGLIISSINEIETAINSLEDGLTPDTVIVDIQKSWNDLANITGEADHSDLLDNMFSNFCLGK